MFSNIKYPMKFLSLDHSVSSPHEDRVSKYIYTAFTFGWSLGSIAVLAQLELDL